MVMNVIAGKSPAPSSIASVIYGISSLVLEIVVLRCLILGEMVTKKYIC